MQLIIIIIIIIIMVLIGIVYIPLTSLKYGNV